jgi:hypothetical protein
MIQLLNKYFLFFILFTYRFKYLTVTTGEFRDLFVEFVMNKLSAEQNQTPQPKKKGKKKVTEAPATNKLAIKNVNEIEWIDAFFSTGVSKFIPDFNNPLSTTAIALADRWITLCSHFIVNDLDTNSFSSTDIKV